MKAALKEYTADRVTLLSRERRDQIEPLLAKVRGFHERMWRSAIKATQDNAPLMAVVLPPINQVIDLHSAHLALAKRHLPVPIMTMLLGSAAIGVGMIGFGNGRVSRARACENARQMLGFAARSSAIAAKKKAVGQPNHHSAAALHLVLEAVRRHRSC